MTDTLMTDAATTTEGSTASQSAESAAPESAQAAGQGGEQAAQQQQATEGQTDNGQQGQDGKTEGGAEKPQGAPEKYEFKAPEGRDFDPDVIAQYSEVAKELNLPQDAAQKIIDKIAPALAEKQQRVLEEARNSWAESAKTDKEFGGDKLNDSLAAAKKALDTFGSPELRTLLNESGLGNHPEVIRMMVRAGKAISEDKFVGGSQGKQEAPKGFNDYAASLYPSQQKGA